MHGDCIYGDVEILYTPCGKILLELIKHGMIIEGVMKATGDENDFEILTWNLKIKNILNFLLFRPKMELF